MEKISQVGKQLREKRKQTEEALQTEFQESLQRLEANLIELSNSKLSRIENDISEKLNSIEEEIRGETVKMLKSAHKFYRKTVEEERREWGEELTKWRKLLLILLPTALIFGLIVGVLATLQFSPSQQSLSVSESEIVESSDGTQYLPISKIPNLTIIKSKDK